MGPLEISSLRNIHIFKLSCYLIPRWLHEARAIAKNQKCNRSCVEHGISHRMTKIAMIVENANGVRRRGACHSLYESHPKMYNAQDLSAVDDDESNWVLHFCNA